MKMRKLSPAFTLVELILVVVILGVMAAFALPNFDNMKLREETNSAVRQLETVRENLIIYFSKMGVTRIPNTGATPDYDVHTFRETFGVTINEPDSMTFECYDTLSGDNNVCRFLHTAGWYITFHDSATDILGEPIYCTGVGCPAWL